MLSINPVFFIYVLVLFNLIPVNFEQIHPLADVRNLCYLILIMISISNFGQNRVRIIKNITELFLILLAYLVFEFLLLFFTKGNSFVFQRLWGILLMYFIVKYVKTLKSLNNLFYFILIVISFSAIYGILIGVYGEPFISIRKVLIGIDYLGVEDKIIDRNSHRVMGLSTSIFAFSYQLALLLSGTFLLFVSRVYSNKKKQLIVFGMLLIALWSVFLNAERSIILAFIVGTSFFYFLSLANKHTKKKLRVYLIFTVVAVLIVQIYYVVDYSKNIAGEGNIIERLLDKGSRNDDYGDARMFQQIAGIETLLYSPFGDIIDDYQRIAKSYPEITRHYTFGVIPAPHNHLIYTALSVGWVGFFLIILFFYYVHKLTRNKLKNIIGLKYSKNFTLFIIVISCNIAVFINSLTHNTGFFGSEVVSILLLGILLAYINISKNNYIYEN
tara:strand:+ start:378 stop:1703 length:1326 start_codon:yes stop_codon:yes gene_type:complete